MPDGIFGKDSEEAKHYNVLQKLAYLLVALVLLPLMLLTGLAMSPGMDAAFPLLLDLHAAEQRTFWRLFLVPTADRLGT
jgi:thiosulfate reductase cytochrome b subunit